MITERSFRLIFVRNVICLILLLPVLLCACKPELVREPAPEFQGVHAWLLENNAQITYGLPNRDADMEQAFRQGYILIYAEGLPKAGIEAAGQKRLTAQRAAEVVAQRGLGRVLSRAGRYGSVRFDTYSAPLTPVLLKGGADRCQRVFTGPWQGCCVTEI